MEGSGSCHPKRDLLGRCSCAARKKKEWRDVIDEARQVSGRPACNNNKGVSTRMSMLPSTFFCMPCAVVVAAGYTGVSLLKSADCKISFGTFRA